MTQREMPAKLGVRILFLTLAIVFLTVAYWLTGNAITHLVPIGYRIFLWLPFVAAWVIALGALLYWSRDQARTMAAVAKITVLSVAISFIGVWVGIFIAFGIRGSTVHPRSTPLHPQKHGRRFEINDAQANSSINT